MILSECWFRFYENVISKEMSKNSARLENFGEKTDKKYREKHSYMFDDVFWYCKRL